MEKKLKFKIMQESRDGKFSVDFPITDPDKISDDMIVSIKLGELRELNSRAMNATADSKRFRNALVDIRKYVSQHIGRMSKPAWVKSPLRWVLITIDKTLGDNDIDWRTLMGDTDE